jgi:hypothetical protein
LPISKEDEGRNGRKAGRHEKEGFKAQDGRKDRGGRTSRKQDILGTWNFRREGESKM